MKTVRQFLLDEIGLEMPEGNINGAWFVEHDLPIIVECECCGMTLALPSAMVDDEGYTFCTTCAE